MNRKLFLLIVLLASLALPLGHLAAQDGAPSYPPAPQAADFLPGEPNDTFATATPLANLHFFTTDFLYNDDSGYFLTPADVDYYTFTNEDDIWLRVSTWSSGAGDTPPIMHLEVALFDAAHNLVAEDTACAADDIDLWIEDAPAGSYFLRLRPCPGPHDPFQPYRVHADVPAPYDVAEAEPNDTRAQATPVTYGQIVVGEMETDGVDCADDWFRFQGRAGDVMTELDLTMYDQQVGVGHLYDANGNYLEGTIVLPANGTYYLRLLSLDPEWLECYSGDYRFRLGGQSLWVSAAVDKLGGNAAIRKGDIVTRKPAANAWAIVFDASDVGITQNVVAFDRLSNGSLLLSLGGAQNVPGLGNVMPQDIIQFVPVSLGENTAGTFEWYLDGSDVGLSTIGEKIDAINWRAGSATPLNISLSGKGSVPRQSGGNLTVADEDVINFVVTQVGANTAGKWRMSFDGSTRPGLAAENINALVRVPLEPERLSFMLMALKNPFNLGGVTGGPLDVLGLEAGGPAPFRLTDKAIDGLAIGPSWTE